MVEERPIVYHVGRSGDIPGGMTQVVNAYLSWHFVDCDVEVIESRGNPGDHVAAAKGFLRALRKVRAIAASARPSVIVVHLSERGSFVREGWIARYAASRGLPVVEHMHGADFAVFERDNERLVGKVLAAATRTISLSEETSAICARHIGADRVDLVPNAIAVGNAADKERIIVFGGVVSHRKGIDVLQQAWREAAPPSDWRLLVAGPIRDAHLVDRALPQAKFLDSVSHPELMKLLDRAAIAVLPSRDEAMPMFILEAMARKCCVISTMVGSIPAVLSDGCGVLTEAGDASALAAALRSMIADEQARSDTAADGFDRFNVSYSADAVFPRVEKIWLSTLSSTRGAAQRPGDNISTKAKSNTARRFL